MKVTIEFDITPQEARKLMGLPDVEKMQERIIEETYQKLSDSIAQMKDPEKLFQRFMPLGAQGLEQFQRLMVGLASKATGGDSKEREKKP